MSLQCVFGIKVTSYNMTAMCPKKWYNLLMINFMTRWPVCCWYSYLLLTYTVLTLTDVVQIITSELSISKCYSSSNDYSFLCVRCFYYFKINDFLIIFLSSEKMENTSKVLMWIFQFSINDISYFTNIIDFLWRRDFEYFLKVGYQLIIYTYRLICWDGFYLWKWCKYV